MIDGSEFRFFMKTLGKLSN